MLSNLRAPARCLAVAALLSLFAAPASAQSPAEKKVIELINKKGTGSFVKEDGWPFRILEVKMPAFSGAKEFALLKGLKGLRKLEANGPTTNVTNAMLANIRGLSSLQTLKLNITKVGDAGLVQLKGLTSLQELELMGTDVTDKGLKHLHGLKNLQTLKLNKTKVTAKGVAELKKKLPKVNVSL